jgi:hypothetical protein
MIARRDTLEQALGEVESRALTGVSTIVVSRYWWDGLSTHEQSGYSSRAARAEVELRVDDPISSHFVELRGGDEGPPLLTESPM